MVFPRDGQDDDSQYRAVLTERMRRLEASATELAAERTRIDERLSQINSELSHIHALLGPEQILPSDTFPARRVATPTDVIHLLQRASKPLHYRDIERLLREEGFDTGGGADPANTLLARYYDDQRLYRPARGIYDLRSRAGTRVVKSVGERRRKRK